MAVQLLWLFLLIILAVTTADAEIKLRILHTNDMHARFNQTSQLSGKCSVSDENQGKCYGGFPRILTAVQKQRAKAEQEGVPLVFLNAGDTYQGTIWYSVFKWPIVAAFINLLGLDVMSLGNHEFDDGPKGLAPFLKNVTVPVVACNLDISNEPEMDGVLLPASFVLERGNLKIGVIGYLTPETSTLSQIGKVKILDELENLNKEAAKLKASGINIIIALGHSGYGEDQIFASKMPDVDVVVGGHSHSFLYTGDPPDNDVPVGPYPTLVTQSSGRKVPVVQAYAYTKYLGVLDVTFDDNGEVTEAHGAPILLDSKVAENQRLLDELSKWQASIDNVTQLEIATNRVLLDGYCRFNECNLGNLAADAFADYGIRNIASFNWTEAAIAVIQGGSVRVSIEPGVVTREDVIVSFPFYNPLVLISLEGKYLLEMLEWSVTRYDPDHVIGRGEFLQMSGIHVTYNLDRPVGSRVVDAKALCSKCSIPSYEPIRPDDSYSMIVSSFVASGGDNFTMVAEHATVIKQFDATDTDIIADYVARQGLIYEPVEERIVFVKDSAPVPGNSAAKNNLNRLGYLALLFFNIIRAVFTKLR